MSLRRRYRSRRRRLRLDLREHDVRLTFESTEDAGRFLERFHELTDGLPPPKDVSLLASLAILLLVLGALVLVVGTICLVTILTI